MENDTTPASDATPSWKHSLLGKKPVSSILRLLALIFLTFILFKFILLPIRVTGYSMWPTFHNGEIKFINRVAYLYTEPQRGDVVAVEFSGEGAVLLKRIIALPGESFSVRDGDVYINGELLFEPYAFGKIVSSNRLGQMRPILLEPNQYAIYGDNRPISEGFLKYENQIIGRIF